jgi:antibiotic biosynthesis monooxygenase (ABM) superfamily enzyme
MVIVIVTFKISSDITESILKEKFMESSYLYKDTPGLIRKNYLSDVKNNTAGGVYCFDTLENAQSWFDDKRIDWLTQRYSKPEINFYDNPIVIDNISNEIIS